jgi:hypothetical protein
MWWVGTSVSEENIASIMSIFISAEDEGGM